VATTPRVIAITVNYNGGAFLEAFLRSFRELTYPNLSLIVVDNASRDGSAEAVPRLLADATLIRLTENTGFTGGNNIAVRAARAAGAEYVLFINNDTRLDPALVDALVAEADARTLVAPCVFLEGASGLLDDTVGEFSWLRGAWRRWTFGKPPPPELQRPGPAAMASLCCLLVPAAVFRAAGLLDERMFMYYEDFDFIRRARRAGFRLRYTPAARLWHRKSASSGGGDTPFKLYYATRNRLYVLARHQPPALFAGVFLWLAVTRLVRAAQYTAHGRADLARAVLAGMLDFLRGRMGRTWLPASASAPRAARTGSAGMPSGRDAAPPARTSVTQGVAAGPSSRRVSAAAVWSDAAPDASRPPAPAGG
jgi:GT2 family glycosyltransferase